MNSFSGQSDLENALAEMRLRLLDLSGRNRLLNFKHTAGRSLQFIEGNPLALFKRLLETPNRPVATINGLPEPARRDWVERNGRLARPDPREWAKQHGVPVSYELGAPSADDNGSCVRALIYTEELAKHCRKLEREAASAIQETGANMLFLVFGFLEYPDQRDSDKKLFAPLVSVPASLTKAEVGGNQIFSLQYTGDDVTDNLCLREKLRIDYDLFIPEIEDEEVNLERYLNELNRLIQRHPGFKLRQSLSLCMLSFTNMLLVRDLDPSKWPTIDGKNSLLDHPTIRKVFEGAEIDTSGSSPINVPPDYDIESGPEHKLALVFDADSSQHCALADVIVQRRNLVIEGPPGTGKSQTITNLIAAALAENKTVLFVAEKLAALEVVKTRLNSVGLDPFVLELHSNKSNKKKVLEEIKRRVSYSTTAPADLQQKTQLLERHRNELRSYQALVNSICHNNLGLTLHQIMWRAESHRLEITTGENVMRQILVADAATITALEVIRRAEYLGHLGNQYSVIGTFEPGAPFWGFTPDPLVHGDEEEICDMLSGSLAWAQDFSANARHYNLTLGGNTDITLTPEQAMAQRSGVVQILAASQAVAALHLIPRILEFDTTGHRARRALEEFGSRIEQYEKLKLTVRSGLRSDQNVSREKLIELKKLQQVVNALGLTLGTSSNISTFFEKIEHNHLRLKDALPLLDQYCTRKGIMFDGSQAVLKQLSSIASLMTSMPVDLLRYQHPGMLRDGSDQAIEALATVQNRWLDLHAELDRSLYTDMLPRDSSVMAAIEALREQTGWTRVLSRRWRNGIALHKRLSRSKKRVRTDLRLLQLEKVAFLFKLHNRWRSDSAWGLYLGIPCPDEPISLDGHLTLARWNAAARQALEAMPTPLFSLEDVTRENARAMKRELELVSEAALTAADALNELHSLLPGLAGRSNRLSVNQVSDAVGELASIIRKELDWLGENASPGAVFADCIRGCEAAMDRIDIAKGLDDSHEVRAILGDAFLGAETDVRPALAVVELLKLLDQASIPTELKDKLRRGPLVQAGTEIQAVLTALGRGYDNIDNLSRALGKYGPFDANAWIGRSATEGLAAYASAFETSLTRAVEGRGSLIPWSLYVMRRKECLDLGLKAFVDLLESREALPTELSHAYSYCVYMTVIRNAFRLVPELARFTGLRHDQIRNEFRRLDRAVIGARGQAIAAECARACRPPNGRTGSRTDDNTEMALLNRLMSQQRPRVPLRKMIARAGCAMQSLKPCFMMGPQAVAQYLTPGKVTFDLVVMDEASQLKPEEAIGAIARGVQLVVVGDPKQLPPTSFFSRMSEAPDEEEDFITTNAESILDVCSSHFRPPRRLRWHYRSQHHSLIAFSNHHFYDGGLIVFPSPYGQSDRLGVRATYLADGIYENQANIREAQRVVEAAAEHIIMRPDESLGIVTLNVKQRDLISDLLDDRLRHLLGADAYRERWMEAGQSLFVKNLENVQGDERDAIVISTTFGKPPGASVVRQNFGPISRQGGWRRLNVLFTRARKSVAVYTSMRPEDIVVDTTTPEGTRALRNYLEYARSGNLAEQTDTGREPDSDFEIAVINVLKSRGYEVTPQLGVAGFRIDIAVKHPRAPGTYLAAIECDGATYHSARSVRDRDRIRQEILESLGWRGRIWRIWSTDWFRAPRDEIQKLISFLEDTARTWTPEHAADKSWVEEGALSAGRAVAMPEPDPLTTSSDTLFESDADFEVREGDTVRYVDIERPEDVLTVQISARSNEPSIGVAGVGTPLAQVLLGAVAGDEVQLHLPGARQRTFRILGIVRDPRATR